MAKTTTTPKTEVKVQEQAPVNSMPTLEQAPNGQAPEITGADLQVMVKVIDIASRRGAFVGNEMSSVGQLHDRISRYLQANQPPTASGAPSKTPSAEG